MVAPAVAGVIITAPEWGPAAAAFLKWAIARAGAVIVGGAAGEAARRANEKAKKLKDFVESGPLADELSKTIEKTKAEPCPQAYCPPLPAPYGIGFPVARTEPNATAAAYQALVTGFPPGIEWCFVAPNAPWDGFRPAECMLQEAKGQYAQFFTDIGAPRWSFVNSKDMFGKQALAKVAIIMPFQPPVRLSYYFAHPGPLSAFKLLQAVFPQLQIIETHLFPFPTT